MKKPPLFALSCVLLLLAGTRLAVVLAERRIPQQLAQPLETISSDLAGWSLTADSELSEGVLRALRPTKYLMRVYEKGTSQLNFFVAYYAQQRPAEGMHSPKHCLPGSGWEIWKHGSELVPAGGGSVRINRYSVQNSGRRMLMFYWYQSPDRIVASEYMGKMLLVRDALLTGRTAASIVRIIVPDEPGAARDAILFASEVIPQLQRCFGGATSGIVAR